MANYEVEKKSVVKGIKSNKRWVLFWCAAFVIVFAVVMISFSSQRQITVDDGPTVKSVESLTCESSDYLYPFFVYDKSDRKSFRVLATFNGGVLRTISLQQYLYYGDEASVTASEADNHVAMNRSFGENGLVADGLNATYSRMQDGLRFGLYAVYEQMKNVEMQYFLLDGLNEYNYENLQQQYEKIGLQCK